MDGAYHVLRLREGEDTDLNPADRLKTLHSIRESGLALYTCCEPIGPEHSAEEIFDRVFLTFRSGTMQQSAMRRTLLPDLPLADRGIISQLRLAQITAIIRLASVAYPNVAAVASHEPNLLSLSAGSNIVAAEFGPNPREVLEGDSHSLSIDDCRRMLFEAGYSSILRGDLSKSPLTAHSLLKT